MSDKLSDEQIVKLAEQFGAWSNHGYMKMGEKRLVAFARALLAASPAIPAEVATPEPLSDKGSEAISGAQVADQNAPAICVGCEGKPAAGNDPCAICGKSSAPAISESEDARDAARYRWLRSQPNTTEAPRIDVVQWSELDESANEGHGLRMEELDAAIDAARKGEKS
ncbi:hypothetical protein [Burkholderia glumae]